MPPWVGWGGVQLQAGGGTTATTGAAALLAGGTTGMALITPQSWETVAAVLPITLIGAPAASANATIKGPLAVAVAQ